MARTPEERVLHLFIASPGDVIDERESVAQVAARVAGRSRFAIKTHRWEDGIPTLGDGPQTEIERHLPHYHAFDIVVLILWQRYGTILSDGRSGTEQEFQRAWDARKSTGKPEILAYLCTAGAPILDIDPDQVRRLQSFVADLKDKGLLRVYTDRSQFAVIFDDHLQRLLQEIETRDQTPRTSRTPSALAPDLLAEVDEARARIARHIFRTPMIRSKRLERDLNCRKVLFKLESVQITGSFKVRGAMNAVLKHSDDEEISTFSTASAGNHGLGLAYSADRFDRKAAVYMPERTPLTKIKAVERYTSNITLKGENFEETTEYAIAESSRAGYKFIHPYNDPDVIAGQGTLGLEILDDIRELHGDEAPDLVIVPVGGGGLIAGVGNVLKRAWPGTRIIAAEALNVPSLDAAIRNEGPRRVTSQRTFADGIAVAETGDISFALLRHVVDEVWKVSEESMAKAVIRLLEDTRVLAEGAGACGLGSLLDKHASNAAVISNRSIVIVVSGGNLDTIALSKLLQRGLVLSRRLAHLRLVLEDVPGRLAKVTQDLADLHVNILDLWHSRLNAYVRVGTTHADVIIETRDAAHVDSVVEALTAKGHDVSLVTE